MYGVVYSKEASRALAVIPQKLARSIKSKIEELAANPYSQHNNVTKLQGRDGYRLRVGNWRVIYEILDDRLIIHVVRIAARGSAYK